MPTKPTPSTTTISDDAIRQRAYYLWEADGRPEGRSDHYWHLAMTEVSHMEAPPARTAPAKAPRVKAAAKPKSEGTKSEADKADSAKVAATRPARKSSRAAASA